MTAKTPNREDATVRFVDAVASIPGLSYRQADYWRTCGLLGEGVKDSVNGSGTWGWVTPTEVERMRAVFLLVRLGLKPRRAAQLLDGAWRDPSGEHDGPTSLYGGSSAYGVHLTYWAPPPPPPVVEDDHQG